MPDFISLTDVGMAYRKAKVDVYRSSVPNLLDLLAYEEGLPANLEKLWQRLLDRTYSTFEWAQSDEFVGGYMLVPKGIEGGHDNDDSGFKFFSDDEQCRRDRHGPERINKPVAEFRVMAKPSIDFHVLSALWIAKVGHLYDDKLTNHSYGSRLRRKHVDGNAEKGNGALNPLSLGSFKYYATPFKQWRDNGLRAMRDNLARGKSIVAITSDVQEFYHKLNPEFLLHEDFLNLIGLTLTPNEKWLTQVLIHSVQAWAKKTPVGTGLPVGVAASALIANVSLIGLDKLVLEKMDPVFYGRYVDDIILVLDFEQEFASAGALGATIAGKSDGLLALVEGDGQRKGISFAPSYHVGSTIFFSDKKTKVFVLEGETGKALVDSLVDEIHTRASEWRALPSLPSGSKSITTDLVLATSRDGERVEKLRKADSLSMRRSLFALRLRDFEAYQRDLLPPDWEVPRKAFIKAFTRHVLVLPEFFQLANFLPRIIGLATACGDFLELRELFIKLEKIHELVSDTYSSVIAGSTGRPKLLEDEILNRWAQNLHLTIEENVKASFPSKLTATQEKHWEKLKVVMGNWEFHWMADIESINKDRARLFMHDLAHQPLRVVGLPAPISFDSQENLANMVLQARLRNHNIFVDRLVSEGVELLTGQIKQKCETGLPIGFLFPTRPYNLMELHFVFDNPYSELEAGQIEKINLALRGFTTRDLRPYWSPDNQYPILTIPTERGSDSVVIALTSWLTKGGSHESPIKPDEEPSLERYERLMKLMNAIMKSASRPHYVVLPELSVPGRWFLSIASKLKHKGIGLISGIDYQHSEPNEVANQVWAALPQEGLGFPVMAFYRQDKQSPAVQEKQALSCDGKKVLTPKSIFREFNGHPAPPVIEHGLVHLGILVCSELTNIKHRSALAGQVDMLFVPEWNKDIETFNSLVESAALDMHAYIVQCNNRLYGDGRIRAPYKLRWKRDVVRVKGGLTDYFVIGKVNVKTLREFQSLDPSPTGTKATYKPVPDGFTVAPSRRRKGE